MKVIIPLDGGEVFVDGKEPFWTRSPTVTRAHVVNESAVRGPSWTLFFPPESGGFRVARKTIAPIAPVIGRNGRDLIACARALNPQTVPDAIEEILRILGQGASPVALDVRVAEAKATILQWAAQDIEAEGLSIERVASSVGLSSSRLSHLFAAQLGIPLKRYALFRRLLAAYALRAKPERAGGSLAAVAAGAGFSDQAHLSRTARRFLGQPASYGGVIVTA